MKLEFYYEIEMHVNLLFTSVIFQCTFIYPSSQDSVVNMVMGMSCFPAFLFQPRGGEKPGWVDRMIAYLLGTNAKLALELNY